MRKISVLTILFAAAICLTTLNRAQAQQITFQVPVKITNHFNSLNTVTLWCDIFTSTNLTLVANVKNLPITNGNLDTIVSMPITIPRDPNNQVAAGWRCLLSTYVIQSANGPGTGRIIPQQAFDQKLAEVSGKF